jgi:hypothetical protein
VKWWVRRIATGIVFFAVGLAVLAGITMFLWNALIPVVFKGPALTYVQAGGLLLLAQFLLRGGWRHRAGRGERWRLQRKLAAMTPEERERFRQEWGGFPGHCGRKAEAV